MKRKTTVTNNYDDVFATGEPNIIFFGWCRGKMGNRTRHEGVECCRCGWYSRGQSNSRASIALLESIYIISTYICKCIRGRTKRKPRTISSCLINYGEWFSLLFCFLQQFFFFTMSLNHCAISRSSISFCSYTFFFPVFFSTLLSFSPLSEYALNLFVFVFIVNSVVQLKCVRIGGQQRG